MQALDIHDGVSLGQEVVGKQQRLVHVTAGIVPDVKDKVLHTFLLQFEGGLVALPEGSAGELGKTKIADGILQHEGGIHAVHGNFPAHNLEGDDFPLALYGHGDFGTGGALDAAHHAVLGELYAGNYFVVHLEETVSGHEAHFLRGAAGDDLQHDGGVVGHIELDADSVKVAGKFFLRSLQLLGRQIHRVRIQPGERRHDGGIGHSLAVEGVHVILLHHVQHKVELAPVGITGIDEVFCVPVTDHR